MASSLRFDDHLEKQQKIGSTLTSNTSEDSTCSSSSDSDESPHNSSTPTTTKATNEPGNGWTNSAIPPQMFPVMTQSGRLELYSSHRRLISTSSSGGGWSRTGQSDPNDPIAKSSRRLVTSGKGKEDIIDGEIVAKEIKALMSQLCESFYLKNWQPGTGGGMSVRTGKGTPSSPYRIFTTPSGIQKEDMIAEDIIELDANMNIVHCPEGQQLSSMTNLWFLVYRLRPSTNCVLHTHSMYAQLATMLDATESTNELKLTHLEMIKGVGNHAYDDELVIPIIDNQRSEALLAPDLERVLVEYPKCNAVLVRRHGVYVWGNSWEQAKTQLESFDYLFESAVKMKSLGVDCGVVPVHGRRGKGGNGMNSGDIIANRSRDEKEKRKNDRDGNENENDGIDSKKKRKLEEV